MSAGKDKRDSYAMYTTAGDLAISKNFGRLEHQLGIAETISDQVKAFEVFMQYHAKVARKFDGTTDTAVREIVVGELEDLGKAYGIPIEMIETLWDSY